MTFTNSGKALQQERLFANLLDEKGLRQAIDAIPLPPSFTGIGQLRAIPDDDEVLAHALHLSR